MLGSWNDYPNRFGQSYCCGIRQNKVFEKERHLYCENDFAAFLTTSAFSAQGGGSSLSHLFVHLYVAWNWRVMRCKLYG